MSRVIKFRCWDKISKCWVTSGEDYEAKDEFWGTPWQIFSELLEDYQIPENYELMQFTGLTDRNGVDIYEGDIVRYDDGEEYYDYIIQWHKNGYHYIDPIDKVTDCGLMETEGYEREVIGNVYENGDLLK